jgi:UV excision repair protein RAD23
MLTAEATRAAATPVSSDSSSAQTPVSSSPGAPIHAFGVTSFFPIGEALQSTISNMVSMGFEPDQVQRALRASYNNPDRAVEYLTTVRPLVIALPAH